MATSVEIATNKLNMLLALISSSTISGVDAVSLWTSMKGELFVSLNQTYCIGLQASTPFVDSERTILAAMLSRSMQNLPGLDSATKAMLLQDQKSLESCIRSNLLMNVGESVAVLQSNRKGSWTFERSKQILDVVPSMGSTSLWFLYNKNLNPFMTQMTS